MPNRIGEFFLADPPYLSYIFKIKPSFVKEGRRARPENKTGSLGIPATLDGLSRQKEAEAKLHYRRWISVEPWCDTAVRFYIRSAAEIQACGMPRASRGSLRCL